MDYEKEWSYAMNILCIRLDSLGDVLMTIPALHALKRGGSGRRITLLTSLSGAKAVPLIPEIDDMIVYEAPWMKCPRSSITSRPEFEIIERLRSSKFDAAVIFTVFSQNPLPAAVIAFMAEIPLRLAYCRENPYHLLTNWLPDPDRFDSADIRHEVKRQLDLVGSVGAGTFDERLSLSISRRAVRDAQKILNGIRLDMNKPWLIIHAGASAPSRRYPAGSFAEAAEKLILVHGFQVLFTGTRTEVRLVESIRERIRAESFSLAGRLNIKELSAVISLAPLLISNNTAPVHIAAALETPVVDLYALTNPQHTPWKVPHRILYEDVACKFCYKSECPMEHHNCLRLVPPESVVRAAIELFESGRCSIPERQGEEKS